MTISILGCGWLGLPVGQELVSDGYSVHGSTTTQSKIDKLRRFGIKPALIRVDEEIVSDASDRFWESEILFLNIPPGRSDEEKLLQYPGKIERIADRATAGGAGWIIFASSTSVYHSFGGLVSEQDANSKTASGKSGKILLECEHILKKYSGFDTTVLRFGGLYGGERHPVRYLAGRKNLGNPDKSVNLIHRDDCTRIVREIIRQNVRNVVLNAVSDGHPSRKEYYQAAAKQLGLDAPEFMDEREKDKNYRVVSNKTLKKTLNYTFLHPEPMALTGIG